MKPQITVMNEEKIHVSRKPGFTAWLFLSLSTIIFIGISQRLTTNFLYLITLLLGEVTFGLDLFGEWQDLLLDKKENKAVIIKHTWIDKLFSKMSSNAYVVMKLNDIRHIGVSMEMGLFILHRSGRTITLSMQGFTREELQKLKRSINNFLHTNKVGTLDIDALKSSKFVTFHPEYLYHIQKKRKSALILKTSALIDTLRNDIIRNPVHRNLSLPILDHNRQKKKHRQCSL